MNLEQIRMYLASETNTLEQADLYIAAIVHLERERINGIIEQFIENSDYPEVVSSLEWLQDVINGDNK